MTMSNSPPCDIKVAAVKSFKFKWRRPMGRPTFMYDGSVQMDHGRIV